MRLYCTDSLVKIFPETKRVRRLKNACALSTEKYRLQLFILSEQMRKEVSITCSHGSAATIFAEDYIAALNTALPGADAYTVGKTGLYPDLLHPFNATDLFLRPNIPCPVFVEIDCAKLGAGRHVISFSAVRAGEIVASAQFVLTVMPAREEPCDLIVTNWLHCDCIVDYYRVSPKSDRYFFLTEKYIETAVEHGMNTVLVPCFTPPLDTAVGQHRTNVQLVDVEHAGGEYTFGFSRLERFVELAERAGIEYYEICHLFSQWGAKSCPDIRVKENGKTRLRFGYKTDACSEEYRQFLRAFLPALDGTLKDLGLSGRVLYHISDEPNGEHLERYRGHLRFLKEVLPDCRVMDALSDFAFRDIGIDLPVVAIDACRPFIESGTDIMVYYCTGQDKHFEPNCFFCTPSERNRVLGVMLYKSGAHGFLHWGYNFYNSYLSLRKLDPHYETDGAGRYQAGDAFLVYPGRNAALPSLRLKVFADGMQDYKLLKAVEKVKGRRFVLDILEHFGYHDFSNYPHEGEALLRLHDELCRVLSAERESENGF